jgi:hypothetical protein
MRLRLLDLCAIGLLVNGLPMIGLVPVAHAGALDQAPLRGSSAYDPGPVYRVIGSEPTYPAPAPSSYPSARASSSASATASPYTAYAADYPGAPRAARPLAPPPVAVPSAFKLELGSRVWFSTGTLAKDLYDDPRSSPNLNSRLTYSGLTTGTLEAYGRVDTWFGSFFKGYVGFGGLGRGSLDDEDFVPAITPYSSTLSQQQGGKLGYASVDFGQNLVENDRLRVGLFAGYGYLAETVNAYGCDQVGANPFVCVPTIPTGILGITEQTQWQFARLGLSGEIKLLDCLKLSGEVAWLPYEQLNANDTHWLRLGTGLFDISGPIPEFGGGTGIQLEAILSYQVTNKVSLGLGGRYWFLETHGTADFENVIVGFPVTPASQPLNFTSTRYGGFAQGSYKFEPL